MRETDEEISSYLRVMRIHYCARCNWTEAAISPHHEQRHIRHHRIWNLDTEKEVSLSAPTNNEEPQQPILTTKTKDSPERTSPHPAPPATSVSSIE